MIAVVICYDHYNNSFPCFLSLTGINKREHMDMSARLFANLGVVQECLGNFDKGIELIQKSINICKTHDIFEQLERGYSSIAALYGKKGDHGQAIHFYNLAIDVAGNSLYLTTLIQIIIKKNYSLIQKSIQHNIKVKFSY